MRIARLDLTKYGKFTGNTVSFPQSTRDFHFIVGANEAGKSTLRSAILDLLFGIENRSKFDFQHPLSEMELGAEIDGVPGKLEFVRIKKRLSSLLTPTGGALPDSVLSAYLGTADRSFFDQMFGLNHEKLVSGGKQILDAGSDIGQLLFESAAGIANFGKVREELETEANSLWAKTKSASRTYYIAASDYAKAEGDLKLVLVRTKDWTSAQAAVKKLSDDFEKRKLEIKAFEERRVCLERLLRVGPSIRIFQEKSADLANLGDVAILPENASTSLQACDVALAKAEGEKSLAESQLLTAQEALASVQVDTLVLASEADIEALAARRQLVKTHVAVITKFKAEVGVYWTQCQSMAKDLSWDATGETALRERLPSSPVRQAIDELVVQAPVVRQNTVAAAEDLKAKSDELASLDAQIAELPGRTISPLMQHALSAAHAIGDQVKEERNRVALVEKCARELEAAKRGLGEWQLETVQLRHLPLPTLSEVEAIVTKVKKIEARIAGDEVSLRAVGKAIFDQEQEITSFKDQYHLVTVDELDTLRSQRDELWMEIKSGNSPLSKTANAYEAKVTKADAAADTRNAKAEALGVFLGKTKNVERVRQNKAELLTSIANGEEELKIILESWAAKMSAMGLAGMPPEKMLQWRDAQSNVIRAEDNFRDASSAVEQYAEDTDSVREAIRKAMANDHGSLDEDAPLANWIAILNSAIEVATRSEARREQLVKARDAAVQSKASSERKAATAEKLAQEWNDNWGKYLARAGMPTDATPAFAKGALKLFESIESTLNNIQTLRVERIAAMEADLNAFSTDAARIARVVAKEMVDQPAFDIADKLNARLAEATKTRAEQRRLEIEITRLGAALAAARTKHDVATHAMSPLMAQAKVTTRDELGPAIEKSDTHRKLSAEVASAKKSVLEGGGGLTFETLLAEFAANDVSTIDGELAQISDSREHLQQIQDGVLTELTTAKSVLDKIAGQDEAAKAEGARQDAISRMAESASRYIKVHTAAKLLGWAIDKYRDKKQGPMLEKASEIFSMLTLGSFRKLIVDLDSKSQMLAGQRSNNEKVSIDGMSEGARDQLYLALRLAAIELHLDNVAPLPFIADDLFINFDDRRAEAGLEALARLSEKTQVIFLSHHDHLASVVQKVFGPTVNTVLL